MPAQVHLFPCLKDNYGVLLHDPQSGATAAIDAPEAAAVEAALKATGWKLTDILVTHHHADHTDGIPALKQHHGCRVVAPQAEAKRIPLVDETVREGDTVRVGGLEGAGPRNAGPYRRTHQLRVRCRQAGVRGRHAVLDRLRPRDRGQPRNDVAVAAQAARPARRHAHLLRPRIYPGEHSLCPHGRAEQQGARRARSRR